MSNNIHITKYRISAFKFILYVVCPVFLISILLIFFMAFTFKREGMNGNNTPVVAGSNINEKESDHNE